MRQKVFTLAIGVLGLSGAVQADIFTPSIQDQIRLGQEAAKQIRDKEKVLPADDPRVVELNRIGKKIVSMIPEDQRKDKPFDYTFEVIESDEVNAFALPGGPVFFYTGLLDTMLYEDEIAAILGHEILHAHNEHWARQYAGSLRRNIGIIALLTLVNANSEWFTIANMYDSLQSLQYSRGDEQQADEYGFKWMVAAGYNPQGMIRVFETLNSKSGASQPEFLSSHPDTTARLNRIKGWIQESNKKYPALKKRNVAKTEVRWQNGYPTLLRKGGTDSPSAVVLD